MESELFWTERWSVRQKICSSQGKNVEILDSHFVLSTVSPVLPFGQVKQHIWRLHRWAGRWKGLSGTDAWETTHLSYKMIQGYLFVVVFQVLLGAWNGDNFIRCIYKQCNSASEPAIWCFNCIIEKNRFFWGAVHLPLQ